MLWTHLIPRGVMPAGELICQTLAAIGEIAHPAEAGCERQSAISIRENYLSLV